MAKKRLVVGNWKMYVESPEAAKHLAAGLRKRARAFAGVEAWVAPAYPLVPVAAAALKGSTIKVGAQAVSAYEDAPHTGEVSAAMLKSLGASFVIVGHSEQRALLRQGSEGQAVELHINDTVHAQLMRAVSTGLTAILCVGERERDTSGSHFAYIEEQLRTAFAGAQSLASRMVVAYEPVWAIGNSAGDAMSPALLEEMAIFIRKVLADLLGRPAALRVKVLYGGSVEPDNAMHLITEGGVGGLLVGHASATLDSFVEILKACKT